MGAKTKRPAVEGYFQLDESDPHLIGTKCDNCGTFYFPSETVLCRHPECTSSALQEVKLSSRGRLWSYTNACYQPPAPFVAKEPFEPYAIAAVELEKEKLTILGQVIEGIGVEDLECGMEMELTLRTLHEDDEHEYLTWQWQPVSS